jgi:hypothetical protein
LESTVRLWESAHGTTCQSIVRLSLTTPSALYTLYDSAVNLQETDDAMKSQILSSMEPLSKQIAEFSRRLFGNGEGIDYSSLSPYVPYSLYQSAVVQYQLWKQTDHAVHKAALDSLKEILGYFSKRWLIAGKKEIPSQKILTFELIETSRSIFGSFNRRCSNLNATMARPLGPSS